MKNYAVIIALLLLCTKVNPAHAQSALAKKTCTCEEQFLYIKQEIETNYAGYKGKVTAANRAAYNQLLAQTQANVKTAARWSNCMLALYNWIDFFNDGHLQLYIANMQTAKDSASVSGRIKNTETLSIPPKKLKQLSHADNTVEGVYYFTDSSYKIAIIKNSNGYREYAGVILSSNNDMWHEGQVKLELVKAKDNLYRAILYKGDHIASWDAYSFDGRNLGDDWHKAGDAVKKSAANEVNSMEKVQSRRLSDSTYYIRIASFGMSELKQINALFKAKDSLLRNTPFLVLDLRGNGGGSDVSYNAILPYIYTNPVAVTGNEVYATPDNGRRMLAYLKRPGIPENMKQQIKAKTDSMQHHPGTFIVFTPDDTMKMDTVMPYPKKVVILTNWECGSSTEEFLLAAKQSRKVTLVGEHTYGVLDYSNLLGGEPPCKDMIFAYSSTRSRRVERKQGIDGTGIQPDIPLTEDKDWVEEARKYLER